MKQTSKITKGVVLFTILVLPSLLYLYLTSGKHNFVYLPIVASQSQNYLPLIEEDRQGNPSHHFIQDFPLTETLNFRDLDSKIKLVFFSNAKDTLTSKLIGYMLETEVWEYLGNYEDLYFLNFIIEDSLHVFNEAIFSENKIPTKQWINVPLKLDSLSNLIDDNILVGAIKSKIKDQEEARFGETIICDREGRIRVGYNNSDETMFTYNNLSKFEIKLLRDDLKLLLAEYQRELKNKND
ncbi:hypothetical protein N9I98_03760 [Flavobacteriales bacterium]|nr:hypothetical protein [Flavobacteriales bacterium]